MSIDLSKLSSLQQYYLQQRLPGFSDKMIAEESEKNLQKKDNNFYHETKNLWDVKQRAGKKTIAMYH